MFTDGGSHSIDGETTSPAHPMEECMPRFGVVTTEAHLAYAGARLNTVKPSHFFHGSVGPVVRGSQAFFFFF